MECPEDCRERHRKVWSAACLALSGVGFALLCIGSLYVYAASQYGRAADVEDVRQETRSLRAEIRAELRELNAKIDKLLLREQTR